MELDTGEVVAGDAVIGADGIHSVIRRQMLDDGEPRNSGITVYRAIIPMETVPEELRWNTVTWWAGPHCHFVHYPIAGGRFLNLAASFDDHAPTPFSGVPVSADRVRRTFAMLGETPQRLLDLGTDWKSWVLVDRDPVDDWTDGRVVLMGDAAHPMLHYAAQGACQALEDAVVLGELPGHRVRPAVREVQRTAAGTHRAGAARRAGEHPAVASGWTGCVGAQSDARRDVRVGPARPCGVDARRT